MKKGSWAYVCIVYFLIRDTVWPDPAAFVSLHDVLTIYTIELWAPTNATSLKLCWLDYFIRATGKAAKTPSIVHILVLRILRARKWEKWRNTWGTGDKEPIVLCFLSLSLRFLTLMRQTALFSYCLCANVFCCFMAKATSQMAIGWELWTSKSKWISPLYTVSPKYLSQWQKNWVEHHHTKKKNPVLQSTLN